MEAFENAMTIVMALGGSTNATIHLIAMARCLSSTVPFIVLSLSFTAFPAFLCSFAVLLCLSPRFCCRHSSAGVDLTLGDMQVLHATWITLTAIS